MGKIGIFSMLLPVFSGLSSSFYSPLSALSRQGVQSGSGTPLLRKASTNPKPQERKQRMLADFFE
jgi:hypothetical protein